MQKFNWIFTIAIFAIAALFWGSNNGFFSSFFSSLVSSPPLPDTSTTLSLFAAFSSTESRVAAAGLGGIGGRGGGGGEAHSSAILPRAELQYKMK